MEDTGWYMPNYELADDLKWGRGLGCDFALQSCMEWMETRRIKGNLGIRWKLEIYKLILLTGMGPECLPNCNWSKMVQSKGGFVSGLKWNIGHCRSQNNKLNQHLLLFFKAFKANHFVKKSAFHRFLAVETVCFP